MDVLCQQLHTLYSCHTSKSAATNSIQLPDLLCQQLHTLYSCQTSYVNSYKVQQLHPKISMMNVNDFLNSVIVPTFFLGYLINYLLIVLSITRRLRAADFSHIIVISDVRNSSFQDSGYHYYPTHDMSLFLPIHSLKLPKIIKVLNCSRVLLLVHLVLISINLIALLFKL